MTGSVELHAIIGSDGFIADLRLAKSIPLFDQSAIDAVWQWQYPQTIVDGKPREALLTLFVNFAMSRDFHEVDAVSVVPQLRGLGTGLGLGQVPVSLALAQKGDKLVLTRAYPQSALAMTYAPGAKPVVNKLPNHGSATDNVYTYSSQWDAGRLVTDIAWSGPQGVRHVKETITRDEDTLTVTTTRPDATNGADAFVQTLVYRRVK